MPVVKFFAGLDLEQKSSFLDGHDLVFVRALFSKDVYSKRWDEQIRIKYGLPLILNKKGGIITDAASFVDPITKRCQESETILDLIQI